jgi:uncharacterized protein with von Willebrand factor type A (vWA) domain
LCVSSGNEPGATIEGTARQGWLDIQMRPERHNAVKLLLFGGSMDPLTLSGLDDAMRELTRKKH